MTRRSKTGKGDGRVVDLAEARGQRRLKQYETKIQAVLESSRRALNRLFSTNLLYSHQGTRAGRDLLLVHQKMVKVQDALRRIEAGSATGGPQETEALFGELDGLIEKTYEITDRTGKILGATRRDT